jgi:hypothetical protein
MSVTESGDDGIVEARAERPGEMNEDQAVQQRTACKRNNRFLPGNIIAAHPTIIACGNRRRQ